MKKLFWLLLTVVNTAALKATVKPMYIKNVSLDTVTVRIGSDIDYKYDYDETLRPNEQKKLSKEFHNNWQRIGSFYTEVGESFNGRARYEFSERVRLKPGTTYLLKITNPHADFSTQRKTIDLQVEKD